MTKKELKNWQAEQLRILAQLPDDDARIAYCVQQRREVYGSMPSWSLEELLADEPDDVKERMKVTFPGYNPDRLKSKEIIQ